MFPIGLIFSVRRLHDVGLSGWFYLLYLIPFFSWIFAWSIILKRGQVGANRYAEDPLKLKSRQPSRPVREWTLAVLGSLTVAVAIVSLRIFAFQPFTIPSVSMAPSVNKGDYIIVSKFAYGFSKYSIPFSPPLFHGRIFDHAPQRGDIVVFKLPREPKTDYIKRLIGLPGDRIQIKSSVVFINGRAMARQQVRPPVQPSQDYPTDTFRETTPEGRSYLTNAIRGSESAENTGVYVVPPHCYFVLGDNRDDSIDSRFDPGMGSVPIGPSNCGWDASVDAFIPNDMGAGFVPEEDLVGRAVLALELADHPHLRWLDRP
jgi:signal peptidase I